MPCSAPLPAYRTAGGVFLGSPSRKGIEGAKSMYLPCGGCLGCQMSRAREWAIRCTLELSRHDKACWTTLTYDDLHLPPTLQKRHLSSWLKRLRARLHPRTVRFFASGEYGERTERPHYHAILFGVRGELDVLQSCWPHGRVREHRLTPAAIAYVAGYCSKKVGWKNYTHDERTDPETGEVFTWQPPFVLMSRRPGIGAHARAHWQSWRDTAIHHGQPVPVPRYLHQAWLNNSTDAQKLKLQEDKDAKALTSISRTLDFQQRLDASNKLAQSKQSLKAARRIL